MIKVNRNDDRNQLKSKEELGELLNCYRGILTPSIIDYLNSLIELEFSVIRDYIKEEDRKSLAELDVYKEVAIYNICNRVQKVLDENKIKYDSLDANTGLERFSVQVPINDNKSIDVFDFEQEKFHADSWSAVKIPDGYKTARIGDISLYQTLESKELRETEINRVLNKLERLYDARNPYPSSHRRVGGPGSYWGFEHAQEIERYEKKFTELDSKKELDDVDKKEIEITNQIHNLLLEDYGLTSGSFEERKPFLKSEESVLRKKLVKKETNLTITNYIKYI